jgi:striatin 1/3/4
MAQTYGQQGQQTQSQEYTLPGVLHFLQSEWRRYERDRNEWEIERAEMKVCEV